MTMFLFITRNGRASRFYAARRSGYLALEEYGAIKGDGSDKPNGRIDLYIGQRDGDEEICIEAKHQVLPADCKDAVIENPIANAKAGARRLREKQRAAGAVFLCPYVEKARTRATVDDVLRAHLARVAKGNPGLYAWCFPPDRRTTPTEDPAGRTRISPGTILAISGVPRPKKRRAS